MCFGPSGNLYATQGFSANMVSEFSPAGKLITANFGSGYTGHPESCVTNAKGDVFVGQPDGDHAVLEFNPSGTLLHSFTPAIQDRGTDWIDLEKDQCTLQYTSESTSIKQFNVCTNTQLPDFATGLPAPCYAHRILSDGSVLQACTSEVLHLSKTGTILKTYVPSTSPDFFAMNLDPDGVSFWTANYGSGQIWKINIATGAIKATFTKTPLNVLGGLAIVGEITAAQPPPPPGSFTNGLVMVAGDGGMFAEGQRPFITAADFGGVPGPLTTPLHQVIPTTFVGLAANANRTGYWDVLGNGAIFPIGKVSSLGDVSKIHLNASIVGIAATPDGGGYWLVGSDGGMFNFGDAPFVGSLGNVHLNAPIIGIADFNRTGVWLVASDGGVFPLGDAPFAGSLGNIHLNKPIAGIAGNPAGHGYYLAATDGGVFPFGPSFFGSLGASPPAQPIVAIAPTLSGSGYWLVGSDGNVYHFGDAANLGSLASHGIVNLRAPIVDAVN